ncbi:MAG: hypothetical protein LBI94_00930 [Treponema sp.]|jgi:hypothetical protein|nr:hypothetical protein [Treponema sp.]
MTCYGTRRFKGPVLAVFAFCLAVPLFGAEYEDGFIRLALNPDLGRFSLYYMTDPARQKYEALFMDQDPRTTVLTLSYDNKTYRLGESEEFKISERGGAGTPALVFESSSLRVTEEFSFITTGGSEAANGIKINFLIENTGRRRVRAGLRLLLDTKLGESMASPFRTGSRVIQEETVFDAAGSDRYWISGEGPSLMGSISAAVDRVPDSVHIANWKRLNDVSWSLDFVQGRKFNNPPYSIRDSAVAYFYEPVQINREESVSFFLLLASGDRGGFSSVLPSGGLPVPVVEARPVFPEIQIDESLSNALSSTALSTVQMLNTNPAILRSDYNALQDIVNLIDGYLGSGTSLSDDELSNLERNLVRIRSRYTEP